MHFTILLHDRELNFHRIIDTDYKLSEYLHDNIEINRLELKIPKHISNSILTPCTNYYYSCLKRRELWLRLERNEVDKVNVINWANDMINSCDEMHEVRKYENYISRINDIF